MKCRSFNYLCLSFFAVLGLFFGSYIINENNSVSAVSDLVYTIDSSNASSLHYMCSNSDSSFPSCSDYSYLSISNSCGFTLPSSVIFRGEFNSSNNSSGNISLSPYHFSSTLYNFIGLTFFRVQAYNFSSSDCSLIVTLSENNPYSVGVPSGSLSITANGEYDVTSYATAVVEVPDTEKIIYGDYHDDLMNIYEAIIACAGVLLVLYFFYCIYKIIIGNLRR